VDSNSPEKRSREEIMITRRRFTGMMQSGAAALIAAPYVARGQSLPVVRLGNAAGLIDPQVTFLTMGQHPRLKFYEEEGCQMEILNLSGVGQSIQAIASNNCDTSAVSPIAFLNVYAKTPHIDITFPYCWLRQPHWSIAVKPDSPTRSLADLKGKKIGIRNQGDTGYFGARAMFREIGINPDADVEWISVGEGGPAGEAVYRGRIDAMAFWDGSFARIEIAGFPLRQLPNSPGMQKLFGNCYGIRRSELAKNRDLYVRFFRAMAKSTVFAYANVDLSIKLHWELYPESKPKGKTEQEAFAEARKILESRKDKWFAAPWQTDKRFGAMTREEWEAQVAFAGLEGQVKDVGPVFTTELLDEINKFDRRPIEDKARSMNI
jgi:NitT/TauT family transport system substrate-binding protein